MNKSLGIFDNSDAEDECDEAGCMEMDDEDKDNSGSSNSDSLSDWQDYSCPFCDVKIEEKEDVTNHLESCDADN